MAAEILCTRWTIVLLREMIAGSTRFTICGAAFRACRPPFCHNA